MSRLIAWTRDHRWRCLAAIAVLAALAFPIGSTVLQYRSNAELDRLLKRARFGGGIATHAWDERVDRGLIVLADTRYGPLPVIGRWMREIWLMAGELRAVQSNGAGCDARQILPLLDSAESLNAIEFSQAGEIGAELRFVANCNDLDRLWLYRMDIQPKAVRLIASMQSIEDLELQASTGIDDEAVEQLARLPRLRRLNLAWTELTDAGLEHLRQHRDLEWLWLRSTRITDASVPALIEMAPRRFSVQQTGLSAEGVARLTAALPNSRIDSDYGPPQ